MVKTKMEKRLAWEAQQRAAENANNENIDAENRAREAAERLNGDASNAASAERTTAAPNASGSGEGTAPQSMETEATPPPTTSSNGMVAEGHDGGSEHVEKCEIKNDDDTHTDMNGT